MAFPDMMGRKPGIFSRASLPARAKTQPPKPGKKKKPRSKNRAHLEGGDGKGSIRVCLPVHCLRTGNRTVTQMQHPLVVEGRPNCARQSLANKLSAPRVAATSYCDPSRHANVITPCLFTPCLNVPKRSKDVCWSKL